MDQLALSIESPVLLSPASRTKLEAARKRLKQDHGEVESADEGDYEILERAYVDATNTARSELPPLAFRLRKLWAERGDFSRFRASTLSAPGKVQDDEQESNGSTWDLGADLNGLVDEEEGKEALEDKDGDHTGNDALEGSATAAGGKDVMSIQEMLELRSGMMEKLGTAQNALYFSHALVSLLINSTRADKSSTSNPSAARAGSPTSNSAGGGAAAARGDTAASTSVLQRNLNATQVMGSAANLEAELGIEPFVFGASRLEAERKEVEPRGGEMVSEEDEEEVEVNEDEEDLEVELKKQKKEDLKLSETEREESMRELVDCYQGKKQGLGRAAEILRKGASALRGNEDRNKREKMRWQVLLDAKRTGWSLTPDKPARGTANNRRELLEDGNRIRDQPARDAWIGYAAPEANTAYRRRALAYFNHDIGGSTASACEMLAFASRPRKHLQIRFVFGGHTWISERVEENIKDESDSVDGQLRRAQTELADTELFDAIVGECRALASSSLFAATINTEDSISISLNGVELFLEMVKEDEEQASSKEQSQPSALATAALALLRLGLIRHYRSRDDVKASQKSTLKLNKEDNAVHTPLLLSILGPLHFATFMSRLQSILEKVERSDPRKTYQLDGLEKLQDCQRWLNLLLQGSYEGSSAEALNLLGGSATIFLDNNPVAFLDISYPSNLSLSLPLKRNTVGERGVYISRFDFRALEGILSGDLQ